MRYALVAAAVFALSLPALAQENAARPEVGKPVQQAQALVRERKFSEALAELKKAGAVPQKSPYETYIIAETRAAAAAGAGDYAAAAAAVEDVLATGVLPPADAQKRVLTLVELDYQLKDYAKTVDAADRYYKDGGADPEPRRLMAQSYFLEGDYAAAAKTIRVALAADARAGKAPDEQLLLALAQSEYKTQDEAGYLDAEERLVAAYPKHRYWADLCRAVANREGFASRLKLDLDRVAVAAGAFDQPQQYMSAAELALQAGYPGDAKAFLEKGAAAGVLGQGAAAARATRLAAMAKSQSDEDQKTLAQEAREAAAALQQSLAKGGLDHPEDAKLHLGMVYATAGDQRAEATLKGVTGGDGTRDLAQLWLLAAAH